MHNEAYATLRYVYLLSYRVFFICATWIPYIMFCIYRSVGAIMVCLREASVHMYPYYVLESTQSDMNEAIISPIIEYNNKYKDRFDKLDSIPLESDALMSLMNSYIFEKTPLGHVIMNYSYEYICFHYYSNVDIPFSVRETVARKYAIQFQCKSVYIIMGTLGNDKKCDCGPVNGDNAIEELTQKPKIDTSLYASFKNYSTQKGSGTDCCSGAMRDRVHKRINCYHQLGKLMDFSFLQSNSYQRNEERSLTLNYADYKKSLIV